jgi:phosphoglycolate phosphatase-like HAD superfamily hydrolase
MRGNPLSERPIEAVLFDLDGTLVETDNRWVSMLAQKLSPLRRLAPKLDTNALARRLVMGAETPANYLMSLLEHLGLGSSLFGLADRLRRSKGIATRDSSELVEGSEDLLRALSRHYRLAVVTTRARPEARAFIYNTHLEPYFQAIVTRQDVLRMKPHPEPVRKAAAFLGVPPERCVMVGDTTPDIRSARAAGACAVGVLSGFGERDELEHAGAQLILGRAAELLEYLPA